jgi:hypothetical protein
MASVSLSSPQGYDTKEGKMRQFFMVTLVALATGLLPAMVRADNANQDAAQRISNRLTESGHLILGDSITVRYLDGTVWLQGHVHTQDQMEKAVAVVYSTQGIAINQVVRDELTCDNNKLGGSAKSTSSAAKSASNPLRGSEGYDVNRAQALSSSFSQSHSATPVAMMQPLPPVPAAPTPVPGKLPAAEAASGVPGAPLPMYAPGAAVGGPAPVRYDHPAMPAYAWPSYAAYPNYAAVTYPKQYSPTAWPYIGPFYPYPQVPLGWRKVSLEWDNGWWWLDFKDKPRCCWWR